MNVMIIKLNLQFSRSPSTFAVFHPTSPIAINMYLLDGKLNVRSKSQLEKVICTPK